MQHKGLVILNLYVSQNMVSKCIKKILTEQKERQIKITFQFQKLIQQADQKINKEIEFLPIAINKLDLIVIYRISYQIKYTHGIFTKTDHMLVIICLNKF